MELFGILDFNFFVQSGDVCTNCPASAFNPVSAAFATLGYYAQAEWLYQIVSGGAFNGLASWAMLAYLLSAIGLLVSLAVGVPPRMYLWFAMGPGLFWWLVDTRVAVPGVAWRVGSPSNVASERPQSEVWKLVEVGLVNETYVLRNGISVSKNEAPYGGSMDCDGDGACVSQLFLMVDVVVSDAIQQLAGLIGVSRSRQNGSAVGLGDTNISDLSGIDTDQMRMWDLTANLKWEFIYSITSARIGNNQVREYFATFMASECGKSFIDSIDMAKMTAATYSAGKTTMSDPDNASVLTVGGTPSLSGIIETNSCSALPPEYSGDVDLKSLKLIGNLKTKSVPNNAALRSILKQGGNTGSIAKQSGLWDAYPVISIPILGSTNLGLMKPSLSCDEYLITAMQLLRWEAASITYQMLRSAPGGLRPDAYAAQMLYGWDIKDRSDSQVAASAAPKFLENLVLVHLFRNELQIAPSQIVNQKLTASQRTIKSTQDFQRINGQAAKYGELYTWALMMPFFQGKLLYFLAVAYPFAAMLIVVPGMHSVILMWIQFWIWVKLWDLGFAIVTVLERSVWAMTSNSMSDGLINRVVWDVYQLNPTCYAPTPDDSSMTGEFLPTSMDVPLLSPSAVANLVDKLLFLSNNISLDMANTYYIYIMSALYFAIPAVTGQLVLGAKSGAAGMVSSAIGQIASPAGSAAGQSAAADIGAKMKMNQAVGRQEAYAGALRNSGLAKSAIGAANSATSANLAADAANSRASLYGVEKEAIGTAQSSRERQAGLQSIAAGLEGAAEGYAVGKLGRWAAGIKDGGNNGGGGGGGIGGLAGIGSQMAQYGVRYDSHQDMLKMSKDSLALAQRQAAETETAFGQRAAGSVDHLESNRGESHASFVGEQAAWKSANDYAQANSEFAAAIGLGAGYLDAGQKPTNMQGMAREGMLGSGAQKASLKSKDHNAFYGAALGSVQNAQGKANEKIGTVQKALGPEPESGKPAAKIEDFNGKLGMSDWAFSATSGANTVLNGKK
jgi:hypothetical protein